MALSPYRSIWTEDGYADWLGHLAGANGVYVARRRARRGEKALVLYVGESHTHRLRETLQRHFQNWNGKTAGPTFDAAETEVAFEVFLSGDKAIKRQDALIRRLRPIHNVVIPESEEAPVPKGRNRKPTEDKAYEDLVAFFDGLGS